MRPCSLRPFGRPEWPDDKKAAAVSIARRLFALRLKLSNSDDDFQRLPMQVATGASGRPEAGPTGGAIRPCDRPKHRTRNLCHQIKVRRCSPTCFCQTGLMARDLLIQSFLNSQRAWPRGTLLQTWSRRPALCGCRLRKALSFLALWPLCGCFALGRLQMPIRGFERS